ncbi:MAG: hypothetical protein ACYDDQ_02060 [Vulcanimicrobiaceae bacterium]
MSDACSQSGTDCWVLARVLRWLLALTPDSLPLWEPINWQISARYQML